MASKTIRRRIIDHLYESMSGTSWDTWSPAVYLGMVAVWPSSETLPVLSILPRVEDAEPTSYGTSRSTMRVDMSAVIRIDEDENPVVSGEAVFGEILQAAWAAAASDTLADRWQYSDGGIDEYPETGGQILRIGLTFEVIYQTLIGNPYSQGD